MEHGWLQMRRIECELLVMQLNVCSSIDMNHKDLNASQAIFHFAVNLVESILIHNGGSDPALNSVSLTMCWFAA
jgi:hypothetical protein